jgi:glycosyltransferase involved in cell wall biosynthesis
MSTRRHHQPALTIVIPTVNRAGVVGRAIESALAQTSDEIEIVVSDNGSTDDTPAVLSKYQDPRLRKIRHERTVSAEAHGNFLLEEARGEFFLGLSDDDYIEPEFAARVLDLYRRRQLSFVYTGCMVHYARVSVPAVVGPEVESGTDYLAAFFDGKREVCWCACVTRVADLRAIGPIPEGTICGDMFYWTKLAFDGDVGCVAAPLSNYTLMNTDNISSGAPVVRWAREMRMLADQVISGFEQAGVSRDETEALRAHCVEFVARSTANQFIWNAIRGKSRLRLLQDLRECAGFVSGDRSVWSRVAGALGLPRAVLVSVILKAAAQRAVERKNHYTERAQAATSPLS